jgi:4-amino-4-deoxy-L-arabinose transferase-like glycosyltransferase
MLKAKNVSALHLILLLSAVLSLVGIWWGLPNFTGWAPDELIPSRVIRGMSQFFSHGWQDKYPPFHYYLISLLYLPFWILHRLQILDWSRLNVYTVLFYLARLLSAAMGTGIVYLVYRCGREIYERRASLFAALIASLLVPFVYYSKTANLDVPCMFWVLWSLYFFIRILKAHRTKDCLLFALTAALAVCTKDLAYGFYVFAPFLVVWSDWRDRRQTPASVPFLRLIGSRKYLSAAALAAGVFLLIHNVIFNWSGFLTHFRRITGPGRKLYAHYPGSLAGRLELLGETVKQIQGCLGWPLFLICVGGLVWFLAQKKKDYLLLSLLGLASSYYLFYINIILYNFARFNLPICVILAFYGGRLLSDGLTARWRLLPARRLAVAFIFLYSFFYASSVDILMVKDSRYAAERWMKANVPPQALIGVAAPVEYSPRLRGFKWEETPRSLPVFNGSPKPDYIVVDRDYARRFKPGTKPFLFFSGFHNQKERYKLVYDYKTRLPWLFLSQRFIIKQINLINPQIQIYKKVGQPGAESTLERHDASYFQERSAVQKQAPERQD